MVLRLKTRESRALPGMINIQKYLIKMIKTTNKDCSKSNTKFIAGWSSPVARQAHNLKVAGSNPAPATKFKPLTQ